MNEGIDALELELRRLPGVVGVGFGAEASGTIVHLFAPGTGSREELRRRAAQLTQAHLDTAAQIEIDDGRGPVEPAEMGRVRLLAVRLDTEEGEVEVHLSHEDRRTVGRGTAHSLKAAAAATIDALVKLGANVPFRVGEVVAIGQEGVQTVLVALDSMGGDGARHGAADGSRLEEAAARATLHALNRWLSGPDGFPSGGAIAT